MTDRVKINREEELALPTGERMAVGVADWARIRRHVGQLGDPLTDNATTWAATAIGAAIGLAATTVVLMTTDSRIEAGVIPSLWVAVGFSTLFGICFGLVGKSNRHRHGINVHGVCEDMDDVSERLGQKDLGVTAPLAQSGAVRRIADWLSPG